MSFSLTSRPDGSMRTRRFSSRPPGASSKPSASSSRAPSAWRAPAPPSEVPESPQPTRTRRTRCRERRGAVRRRRTWSLTLGVAQGAGHVEQACDRRHLHHRLSRAPSSAKWVPTTWSPTGPVAYSGDQPPAGRRRASATAVPSPPSTRGSGRFSASGSTRRTPAAMASAAAWADRDSLKPLGAGRRHCSVHRDGEDTDGSFSGVTRTHDA